MVRKGRITLIQPSTHKKRDIGKLEPLFGKEIRFEAPMGKYSRNDYVEFEMRGGKAWVLRRVEVPSGSKARQRKKLGY